MANLKQIKLKRQAVLKTKKVTKAMEAVSAVKMRKSQKMALDARGFAYSALRIMYNLSNSDEFKNSIYTKPSNDGKHAIVLITSDKGLAGSLNSNIIKETTKFINKINKEDIVFYCIGKRGYDFAKSKGYNIAFYTENKKDYLPINDIPAISGEFIKSYIKGDISSLTIIYTNFISTFEQRPTIAKLLPLNIEVYKDIIYSIVPERGMYSELESELDDNKKILYTLESQEDDLVDVIVPMLVDSVIFHTLLESKASEHSSRMVAMKNATDKAGEVAKELLITFNKARQALITKEISEITSGIEAMKD